MKKLSFIFALMLAFTLTACSEGAGSGNSSETPKSTPEAGQSETPSEEKEETPTDFAENTGEDEETSSSDPENTDDDWDWNDPFDPAVNIEFDSAEEYEQCLNGLDRGSEVLPVEELEAFLNENYVKASNIASFCRGIGADSLDIGVDFNNSEAFEGEDGFACQCAPTDLGSEEEFWGYAAEYFSAATVEQLKNATADHLLREKDGVLYVAIGIRDNNYYYDIDTAEIIQQVGDKITLSIVKSYFILGEEKIALRDLVKEDGKWKFDFIM